MGHLAYLCACALGISMSLVLIGHRIDPPNMTPISVAQDLGHDLTPPRVTQ